MATTLQVLQRTVLAPQLLWDTVWDGFAGDYAAAAPTEASNRGGLRARAPLETAIILCLMSDARADPSDDIPDGSGDPRGWPGDACEPAVAPLGSKLWQLRRSTLTDAVAAEAQLYATQALQPLIGQGAVGAVKVTATANLTAARLELDIALYRRDGALLIAPQYAILWEMSSGLRHPLDP